ncbi:hypothetical protein Tco_0074510, partial [Tanacetum coccineum]
CMVCPYIQSVGAMFEEDLANDQHVDGGTNVSLHSAAMNPVSTTGGDTLTTSTLQHVFRN